MDNNNNKPISRPYRILHYEHVILRRRRDVGNGGTVSYVYNTGDIHIQISAFEKSMTLNFLKR